jgi:hypothetical protein
VTADDRHGNDTNNWAEPPKIGYAGVSALARLGVLEYCAITDDLACCATTLSDGLIHALHFTGLTFWLMISARTVHRLPNRGMYPDCFTLEYLSTRVQNSKASITSLYCPTIRQQLNDEPLAGCHPSPAQPPAQSSILTLSSEATPLPTATFVDIIQKSNRVSGSAPVSAPLKRMSMISAARLVIRSHTNPRPRVTPREIP